MSHWNGTTRPWGAAELQIVKDNADGVPDSDIAQKLVDAGFERRTAEAIRKIRTKKLGLIRKTGAQGHNQLIDSATRVKRKYDVSGDDQREYWGRAKRADAAFQARLFMAGVRRETVTEPCTEKPMTIRAEPIIRQSGGFVYPEKGPR